MLVFVDFFGFMRLMAPPRPMLVSAARGNETWFPFVPYIAGAAAGVARDGHAHVQTNFHCFARPQLT